eukprot:TRINITY_DN1672_c0_g1_i6.p1 TRINITY_DN1672_c0_g1~~TRINITY_DN1672_c0_g1_i6.p1  ORF type:complete len:401 (-),score=59.79 TRINITY_DN1672_c0_g1_i6:63-1265(-)
MEALGSHFPHDPIDFLRCLLTDQVVRLEYNSESTISLIKTFSNTQAQDLRGPVMVTWKGSEEATDLGGVTKATLCDFARKIKSQQHFLAFRGVHDVAYVSLEAIDDPDALTFFRSFGQIAGFALFHLPDGFVLPIRLATAFFQVLLGIPLDYNNLVELDSDILRNMQKLYEAPENVAACELTFSVQRGEPYYTTIDLKPNGSDILVTAENLTEYCMLLLEVYLGSNEHSCAMLQAFAEGFTDLVPASLVQIFSARELRGEDSVNAEDFFYHIIWVCGHVYIAVPEAPIPPPNCNFERTQEPTLLQKQTHDWLKTIILQKLSQEQLLHLSRFITGCSVPPKGGYAHLGHPLMVNFMDWDSNHFPMAHTCSNTMDVSAMHLSLDQLLDKLLAAIQTEDFQTR